MTGPARIGVEVDRGRARLTRLDHGEFVAARLLRTQQHRAQVALLASTATLLAGDHVDVEIEVGPGATLDLVEPTGTVAYNARGGRSSWRVRIRLAAGARLTWTGAPFVVAGGAHVDRTTEFELAEGAQAAIRELLVLGRSRDPGGALRARCRADVAGQPLLLEDLDLTDPGLRATPAMLGASRVMATALLLGAAQPADNAGPAPDRATLEATGTAHRTELAGPGALARALSTDAHTADAGLDPVWHQWRALVDPPW